MNPYEPGQAVGPELYPRDGIDRRTWTVAIAGMVVLVCAIALVVVFWLACSGAASLYTPETRVLPLPTEAEQQKLRADREG
jgi:hypothetical protein